jgi:pimeloyl-ACP methyl ester carboxylesterase
VNKAEVKETSVNGTVSTTWELGERPPLVFLHGAGGAANMFAG